MDKFTGQIVKDPVTGRLAAELATDGLGHIGKKYIEINDLDKGCADSYNNGNSGQASEYGKAKDVLRHALAGGDGGPDDLPVPIRRPGGKTSKKHREHWEG